MTDDPKATPAPDMVQDDRINAIGAAGQSSDPFVEKIVSGQPAGGPSDLGKRSQDERPEDDKG